MGFLDDLLSAVTSNLPIGRMSLRDATKNAPNAMGCYQLYLHGRLKYVGKAEYGLRHRFVQYYNGTTAHYPSAKKILANRDDITVMWKICSSREECQRLEDSWIMEKQPEWNDRRGWSR